MPSPGERDAGARAERREHERVGQHLTDDAPTAGAERGAHRQLPFTQRRANQQQVGNVRAGDQQQKHDGAGQRENRGPDLFDQGLVHRLQPRVEAGGLCSGKSCRMRRDRLPTCSCARWQRDPGLEPADRPQTVRVMRFALS